MLQSGIEEPPQHRAGYIGKNEHLVANDNFDFKNVEAVVG